MKWLVQVWFKRMEEPSQYRLNGSCIWADYCTGSGAAGRGIGRGIITPIDRMYERLSREMSLEIKNQFQNMFQRMIGA